MSAAVTSHSLIARVRAAENGAWTSFVAIYYPMVYRWCGHSGIGSHDASDIPQDVFRALIDNLDSYEPTGGPGSFRRWLRGVTRHKPQDHWRTNVTRIVTTGDVEDGGESPAPELADEKAVESDLALAVRRALNMLHTMSGHGDDARSVSFFSDGRRGLSTTDRSKKNWPNSSHRFEDWRSHAMEN